MNDISFRRITQSDAGELLDILNYYVLNSNFHFSDKPIEVSTINNQILTESKLPRYSVVSDERIIGFGYAYAFRPESTFAETVKFTYWLKPEFTGKGLGRELYELLENETRTLGIKNILVNISSENSASLNFHKKLGYIECGNFKKIANKNGSYFDLIWLQKTLA